MYIMIPLRFEQCEGAPDGLPVRPLHEELVFDYHYRYYYYYYYYYDYYCYYYYYY